MKYRITLSSVGNPDYQQYAPISNPEKFEADTIEEIRAKCQEYIYEWQLGGGNWSPPVIYRGRKKIGYISYNGRIWDSRGWPGKPCFDAKEVIIEANP